MHTCFVHMVLHWSTLYLAIEVGVSPVCSAVVFTMSRTYSLQEKMLWQLPKLYCLKFLALPQSMAPRKWQDINI
jgi:hypothetical protein